MPLWKGGIVCISYTKSLNKNVEGFTLESHVPIEELPLIHHLSQLIAGQMGFSISLPVQYMSEEQTP